MNTTERAQLERFTASAKSIDEFCAANRISRSMYYKLRSQGRAPREMKIGSRTIISNEAEFDWHRQMEAAA